MTTKPYQLTLLICFLINGIAFSSRAQDRQPAPEKWAWHPATEKTIFYTTGEWYGFSKTQQKLMYAGMAKVVEIFHQLPSLNPARGFDIGIFASICADGCGHPKIMSGNAGINAHLFFTRGTGTKIERDAEGPSINIFFNDIYRLFGNAPAIRGKFYEEPMIIDTFRGCTVYTGGLVVITKRKEPLFSAVTKELYLQSEITRKKKELEDIKKKFAGGSLYQQWLKNKDANTKAFLEGLSYLAKTDPAKAKAEKEKFLKSMEQQDSTMKAGEKETVKGQQQMINKWETDIKNEESGLNAMSQSERKATAYTADGKRYVVPNPGFFNTAAPANALQLLIVNFNENVQQALGDNTYGKLFREIKKTLDIEKLKSVLY